MAEFINTVDTLGDDAVIDSIIDRTITEFKDNKLTVVGKFAFNGCKALTEVDLPNVTSTGDNAFASCSALKTVILPNVTSLAPNCFARCTIENELVMENLTTTTYAKSHFTGCTISKARFPKLETFAGQIARYGGKFGILDLPVCASIGVANFEYADSNYCNHLILRTDSVCALDGLNTGIKNVYVPSALVEDYKTATNWSALADNIKALEDYTVDGTITGELDESKI